MTPAWRLAAMVVGSVLTVACEVLPIADPAWAACVREAPAYNGQVVAAFATTVGRIRAIEGRRGGEGRWPNLPEGYPVVACYIDGNVAKAPPGGDPFDRALVVIVDGAAELVVAGHRDTLRVEGP